MRRVFSPSSLQRGRVKRGGNWEGDRNFDYAHFDDSIIGDSFTPSLPSPGGRGFCPASPPPCPPPVGEGSVQLHPLPALPRWERVLSGFAPLATLSPPGEGVYGNHVMYFNLVAMLFDDCRYGQTYTTSFRSNGQFGVNSLTDASRHPIWQNQTSVCAITGMSRVATFLPVIDYHVVNNIFQELS